MRSPQSISLVGQDEVTALSLGKWLSVRGIGVTSYSAVEEFLQVAADSASLDCVVLDLQLPGVSPKELQSQLMHYRVTVCWIGITGSNAVVSAVEAMEAGALTILQKPLDFEELHAHMLRAIEMNRALRTIRSVQERVDDRVRQLTPREREVLELIVRGVNLKGIGARLGVAYKTVHTFRTAMFEKMGVASDVELVRMLLLSRYSECFMLWENGRSHSTAQPILEIAGLLEPFCQQC